MSSVYDTFRKVQAIKTSCYDERSAAFITEGRLSQDITHVRLDKDIKAAVVITDKEGPDESIIFTLIEDSLLKGDYYIYDENYYLVYENRKLTDSTLVWKKQKSLECNVRVTLGSTSYYAYFISGIRQKSFNTLENDAALLPDETALLIMPTDSSFDINTEITVGTKGWKIIDYDKISNDGINYLYVERTTIKNEAIETFTPEDSDILHPMVEYTFDTYDAYLAGSENINIISRTATTVTFKLPFGFDSIDITTHNVSSEDVVTAYEVTT